MRAVRQPPLLDPRYLEKPKLYTGSADQWKLWAAKFMSYMGGIDVRFPAAFREVELQDVDIAARVQARYDELN